MDKNYVLKYIGHRCGHVHANTLTHTLAHTQSRTHTHTQTHTTFIDVDKLFVTYSVKYILFSFLQQGQGTYIYVNGDRYEGEWKDDRRHGQVLIHTQTYTNKHRETDGQTD